MIAALYIDPLGPYPSMLGVDCWDESRDARTYAGPHTVVAHPPCERWGRYWGGGPSARVKRTLGDDGGCFAAALAAVRRWGGVLEHPEASHAWSHHGLRAPARSGGWTRTADGWTCCGVAADDLPDLRWGPSMADVRLDQGFHTRAERQAALSAGKPRALGEGRLASLECRITPPAFAALLVELARAARPGGGQ